MLKKEVLDKVIDYEKIMKKKASKLIFISRILRKGEGVRKLNDDDKEWLNEQNAKFEINCLSVICKTFIASGFNSYVVKLKKNEKE